MDIDVMGTVSALFEIIRVVLSALDLGLLDLSKVIKPLCEVTSLPGCTTLLTGDQMCAEPISITLPEELNLEQCFSDTLLLCEDGEEATDSVLLKLVDSVACVLQELLTGEDAGNLVQGLACTILDLLNSALGTNPMLRMTLGGLLDTLGETAQCS
ncbi:hypothetical protein V5799_028080 [Amblyomma americanum]|uniref:Uncharacterized protein n=1 Tax=Amblyomma americanum TaxID=6943 RepID=A0AAQ4DDW4_AMBAM